MERHAVRLAGVAGICYAALAVLPYLLADPAEVSVYYANAGVVGPLVLLAPVGVALIAVVSGRRRRSDPATMAGVATVMALLTALFTLLWALPAGEIAGGMASVSATFEYHRWALLAAALALAGTCGTYAAAVLGVVGE